MQSDDSRRLCAARARAAAPEGARLTNREECTCEPKARVHEERKIPESVLVVTYTPALNVLMLERADHPGFWQCVTGSRHTATEPLRTTCAREVAEETGLVVLPEQFDDWNLTHRFAIYEHWLHRYAPGITHNTEHVFGLLLPHHFKPRLDPREHVRHRWLAWRDAADACFSWTNAEAVRRLGEFETGS